MVESTCEVCGYQSRRGDIKKYYIVPGEVTREAGKPLGRKIPLCDNCHKELDELCSKVVADMTYDTRSQRFRIKSPQEMVREYEAAYQRFARYKKEQQKIA
ncbi:hypothetical protein ACFLXU_05565 [Chloroflexota bacterium]